MAGVISFMLSGNSAEMVGAVERARLSMGNLHISVADINAAFARAGQSAAGPTAAQFKTAGRAISQSISGIGMTAAMFAGPAAAQIIYPVVLLGKEVKTLAASMKLLHISALEAGGAVAALVAIVATWTAAYNYAKAAQNDRKTEHETIAGLRLTTDSLLKQIQDLNARGKLGDKEALQLQMHLVLAPNSVEALFQATGDVQKRLREVVGPKANLEAISKLQGLEAETRAKSLSGKPRALAELDLEMGALMDNFAKLAAEAGVDVKQFESAWNAFAAQRGREIDAQFSEKDATATVLRRPTNFTALEKMGFAFGNSSADTDYARSTADHTRRSADYLKTIAENSRRSEPTPTND